jgi:hypothetical protein
MIGRKSVVALAILCALVLSAVSVASASATEAVECSSSASTIDKFGAHCLAVPEGKTANFGHVKLSAGSHAITGTNANTASETTTAAVSVLAGTLSGVVTELQCTGLSGTGTLENTGTQAKGTGTLEYTGCTVAKPAGKGCVVNGGKVTTSELAGESEGAGTLAFKPASGTTFATITIASCSVTALNNPFPVTGSVKGTVTGATTTTTEAGVTTQNTLKFGGNKAGLEGALTIKSGTNGVALT